MNADKYLEHWDKNKVWTHLKWPKHQRRFDVLTQHLEGQTFIDVGCGYGHSTAEMKARKPGDWAGLDFTERAITKGRELFPDIPLIFAPDYDLAKYTEPRDGVICSEVLEHVEDDEDMVRGLLSITKKVLVISTPNRPVNDPGHLRIYTAARLRELFLGSGDVRIFEVGPFFYGAIKR